MSYKKPFKMRPLLASIIVATGIAVSLPATTPKANALMPVTDIANFIQATYSNIMRTMESMKELTILKDTLSAIGSYAEMQVDNVNNGFANVIARLDKGEEERQNLEQLERAQPAQDACATVEASAGLNEAACASEDQLNEFVAARAGNHSMSSGGGTYKCDGGSTCTFKPGEAPTVDDVNKKNTVDAITLIDKCAEMMDDQGKSLCENPSLLMFGNALTDKEYIAVDNQIQIAGNINKPVPHADASLEKDSPEAKRARAEDLRRENIRETAISGLKTLHLLQNGTIENGQRKRGEIEVLEKYMSERLGSQNWICEVTQSCTNNETYVPPAEIEKRKIEMDAVMLHIALQQYKSSLRVERYLVDSNLMTIDPVTK